MTAITITSGRSSWDTRSIGTRREFHGTEDDDHNLTDPDGREWGCTREECWLCGTGVEIPAEDLDDRF